MDILRNIIKEYKYRHNTEFYCVSGGIISVVCILRGKLHFKNASSQEWEICRISKKWLDGKYYLTYEEAILNMAFDIREIFENEYFLSGTEFTALDSQKRNRIVEGELQYYNEDKGEWVGRTIDKGIYTSKFCLNKLVVKSASQEGLKMDIF